MRSRNSPTVALICAMSVRASATTLRPAISFEISVLMALISFALATWVASISVKRCDSYHATRTRKTIRIKVSRNRLPTSTQVRVSASAVTVTGDDIERSFFGDQETSAAKASA